MFVYKNIMKKFFYIQIVVLLLFFIPHTDLIADESIQNKTPDDIIDLTVDFSEISGPVRHNAAGILHSFHTDEPPDSLVMPLQLKAFRGRPNEQYLFLPGFYNRLRKIGIQHIQAVVSDAYGYPDMFKGWPGDNADWTRWESVVRHVVQECQSRKISVAYDIWNEPDIGYFWGRDRARWYETWLRGYKIIRSLQGDAAIVGPSISHFDAAFLQDFLRFAKTNNCLPDIISWHELSLPHGRRIPVHVTRMNDLLTSEGVAIHRISINEIIPAHHQFSPGTAVSYFAAIEQTTVESACHSCWPDVAGDNGENRSLDGLLTHDTKQPRSTWWAYKYYGDMNGYLLPLHQASSTTSSIDGIASYDSNDYSARVLIGNTGSPEPRSVRINLINIKNVLELFGEGRISVKGYYVPCSETNPLSSPLNTINTILAVQNDRYTMIIPHIESKGAYALLITPVQP